ncbi:unnamed protein product [Paramecium primaurelia]|uniref:AAA+ ATPase domain-containing protein n=1 Tax=Paramecium primaurelia TaxID=5886 RepID=A0A8S1NUD9_PARPR|nr:unnamed protein product [Paramecium primaurelia]
MKGPVIIINLIVVSMGICLQIIIQFQKQDGNVSILEPSFKFLHSPFSLNKDDLIKKSVNIPDHKFDFQPFIQPDASFLVNQQNIQNLRLLQKEFASDPQNPEKAFKYIRQLNRMQLYDEALRIFKQIDDFRENATQKQHQQLQEQYGIAVTNLKSNQYGDKRRSLLLPGMIQLLITAAILYQMMYFFQPGQSKSKNEKNQKDVPEQGAGRIDRFYNILRNNQTIQEERNIPTRFNDVLGIDEFKEELEEIVEFLKHPKKYTDSGAKLPKGILLVGPPGTGKTLLARALAGEAGCAFFYKSGSEFDEMFVGVGASRVRDIFKAARQKAPSIIFIDEIDSIGGRRRAQDPGYSRDTINQILTEMDGFKQSESVIVIGATNFEQVLDPALKRPGRFDKMIHVPLPDVKGREQIFSYYLQKIKYDIQKVLPSNLARQTSGFSGADIQNMVNVAILNAIKYDRQIATTEDFEFAIDRIAMGVGRKNMHVSDKEKLMTAYHEGGHALTSLLTEGAMPLHKVTILPRGGALGFTSMLPEKDQLNYTRKGIIASIDVAMGGRAAEDLFLGKDDITSGCSNDLAKATDLAYMFVKQLGMDDKISLISIQSDRVKTSDQFDYMVDMEVKKILEESYNRVKNLLKVNESKLKDLATELVKRETLSAEEIKKLLQIN